MAMLYAVSLCIHVITAILGLGQVAGLAVLASSPAGTTPPPWKALRRLARGITAAIVVMLLSGVLLEYASGGSFHGTWWFRVSLLLLVAIGALSGRTRGALRTLESADGRGPGHASLQGVAHLSWAMCALVALAAILMEVKPW